MYSELLPDSIKKEKKWQLINSRSPLWGRPRGIVEHTLYKHDALFILCGDDSEGNQHYDSGSLRLSSGGSCQPGGGVPAAVQHALPHAVIVRAGAPSAQCGRGLAPSADRWTDLSGHQLRFAAGSDPKIHKNSDLVISQTHRWNWWAIKWSSRCQSQASHLKSNLFHTYEIPC